ncbi:MAG: UMP kinase [Candidatus Parcubacteria bacterium]|nr:UMP kinase [Candidatus Parcubacteria bacterium]
MKKFKKTIVISLGGSLISPYEIDVDYLKKFKKIIEKFVKRGFRFVIVTGGGKICRKYNQAARELNKKVKPVELDWLGIKATKVNAELVRVMFNNKSYFKVIDRPDEKVKELKSIIIAGGWKPGASSDNMAVNLAKAFKAPIVINLSNVEYVYDKDPNKYQGAKPFKFLTWAHYRRLIGNKWDPGANWPFDPVASKLAQKLKLEVIICNGHNLENYLSNKNFKGTIIR